MESSSQSPHAGVLLYSGCTIAEVIELVTRLADAQIRVVFAGAGSEVITDRSGLQLRPDASVEDLDSAALDVVIVPGGDPEAIIGDPRVARLLSSVANSGGLIAGICAGVLVMGSAGLLRGRSITHNYRAPWAPPEISAVVERFWEDAQVEPDPSVGVVVDGQVITALPNATIEFAMTVCRRLGVYGTDRAAQLGRYLRGEHVAELHDYG
ncbi:MAG: DJ-1/PfpI family protein [Actinomycetota bacterium]